MRRQYRNLFLNLSLVFGSVIVFIAAAEILLRATGIEAGHVTVPQIYRKDSNPNISYRLKPNLHTSAFRSMIETNSLGFRSPEVDPKKPLVAVLGDSITFGYGLEEEQSIPGKLQALLPSDFVLNAAVPGYNLLQEESLYKDHVLPLHPKAVILVFYWNDLTDMVPAYLDQTGNLRAQGSPPPLGGCDPIRTGILGWIPGTCWLDTHSAVYRVMKKFALARAIKADQAQQREQYRGNIFVDDIPSQNLGLYAKQLEGFAKLLPAAMPKLFILWPDSGIHFALRPQVENVAKDEGFAVLDMQDIFGNNAETLSWDTVHPSAKTTGEAASVIAQFMQHEKLLP